MPHEHMLLGLQTDGGRRRKAHKHHLQEDPTGFPVQDLAPEESHVHANRKSQREADCDYNQTLY